MQKKHGFGKILRSAASSIKAAERRGKASGGAVEARIADNAYYYRRILKELDNESKKLKALPSRNGEPYVFSVIWRYFKKEGFKFDKKGLIAAFTGYDCSSYELDMLKTVIIAAAVIETGLVCRASAEKNVGSVKRLQNSFKLMKRTDVADLSDIYPALSSAERLLNESEYDYASMTDATKAMYRKCLRAYAAKRGLSERDAILKAVEIAKDKGCCVGEVLGVDKKPNPLPYLITTTAVGALILYCAWMLCPFWSLPLLLLPIIAASLGFSDFVFSIFGGGRPCPAIDPDKLPNEPLTLTVITALLGGDDAVFERLERLYLTNRREGLYFGILADLPSAKEPVTAEDEKLIKAAVDRLNGLKDRFGDRFCLFIRSRTADGEGNYCGRERKRGAIEDLVRYLNGASSVFAISVGAECSRVKYLLTLDSDTSVPPEGIAALTGMMLHPLNKPVYGKSKVKSGYAIIQPAVGPCLNTVGSTSFSALLAGVGGIDVYESAAFNRQQTVFGEGVFCGKGIIDINAYSRLLDGVLPLGRVLSHDMPEGNILRTRYVSDLMLTDNVPSGVLAYFERMHRWIRGDVQNISVVHGYSQGARGSFRIVCNVLRHLTLLFSFITIVSAGFFSEVTAGVWACLFALINLLSPAIYTLLSRPAAIRFRARRFFSSVQSGLIQSVRLVAFEISSLCYRSFVTADACVKAVFRMFSGKKLLKWVTASQAEKNDSGSFITYIYRCFPSALFGSVCFFATSLWITRLLGLVWFMFPIYAFLLSQKLPKKELVSAAQRRALKSRALPIWKFFEENVNESTNWLPPDNIQFSPVEATAMRTSPTNIGLYLLSVAAAEDFGFIGQEETERRISKTLDAVEDLPKWNGHLYNWYSLSPAEVIGDGYVSTVDSGNFCVCLVALSRFLYSGGRKGLAERAEALFESADFSRLYNKSRNLFSLGADGKNGALSEACYDLYMSEARSTSYFAFAFGHVPLKHWRTLGRPVVGDNGHIGMASWSGTAFEYFMPQLLLPLYKDSFVYESLSFALFEQKKLSRGRLWGCSESAYYCFDAEMNYQYKAHGVQSLALTRYCEDELILSPYSVYLTLCLAPKEALKTLTLYDEFGMNGKYGLYEALDFSSHTKDGAVVQSYMAHHMGMSLIACANACFDGIFVKRFMNHPQTGAFYELLQEKIPINAPIYDAEKRVSAEKSATFRKSFSERLTEHNSAEPVFHVAGKGVATVIADSIGHVKFVHGGLAVNETHFDRYSTARSLNVCFCAGKEVFTATPTPGDGKFSFESAAGYAAHICASAEFTGRVKYYTDAAGSFLTETKSDDGKSYSVIFAFDVQLCADREFYAHPAFNRLFISAEYDKALNALIYTKNSRDGRSCIYMAVGLADADIPFEYETNKESYSAFSLYSAADPIKESYTGTTGVCVSPFCLIKTTPLAGGVAKLIISVGHTRKECSERLTATRRTKSAAVGNFVFGERENPLLEGIFLGRKRFALTEKATEDALWKYGVSGDYPIIAVLVREFNQRDAEFFVMFFKNITTLNIRIELVFLMCEEDRYRAIYEKSLRRLIAQHKADNFLNRRGGIFFADGNDGETVAVFKDAAVCFTESFDTPFSERADRANGVKLPHVIRKSSYSKGIIGKEAGTGVYCDGGFTVDRDTSPSLPQSYVMAGRQFGAVVTHASLGYTFYGNAALCRIAAFMGDPYGGNDNGEVVYGFENGKVYDLAACAYSVRYKNGVAVYEGEISGREYRLTIFVCPKLPLKVVKIAFSDGEAQDTALALKPLMGAGCFAASRIKATCFTHKNGGGIYFTNPENSFYRGFKGFIACGGSALPHKSAEALFANAEGGENLVALRHKGKGVVYLIGAAPSEKSAETVIDEFFKRGEEAEKRAAEDFAESLLLPIKLCAYSSLDAMFNVFAPYQTAICRFFARGAFYQSGGAYGFRDQLQDCMFLMYSMPKLVRCHILRAAARQYTDGSVQHWWHPSKRDGVIYGVKTKCSDDYLWLPLTVAEYVEKTGDKSILYEVVPYLESPPLGNSRERYEGAKTSRIKESVMQHCKRAIDHGRHYGAHGLPLMGSCDWNDAFSELGDNAESVFCAFLYVLALKRFAPLCGETEYLEEAKALLKRAEEAFEGDRFIRAYNGNGAPLGVEGRKACEIDMLVQAFAVFAGADSRKCAIAMRTAYNRLYDKEHKVLRLFYPAFGRDTEYAGYINAYAKGVRENGGQYTHAAVWFAAACALCGMYEEAKALLRAINPLCRAEDSVLFSRYRGEPYVIAADFYMAKGQKGRMGWSHYTGAAGWFCKTVLEVFMGISLSDGFSKLSVTPRMKYDAVLNYRGCLRISAKRGNKLLYDGKPAAFPIQLEDGEHELTVPL